MQPGTADIFGQPIGLKSVAEFRVDFPYDGVEDDSGGFLQWPGRGVAEAIAQMFLAMGFRVADLRDEQEHGWTFNVFTGRRRSWFQITDLDDCILLVSEDMGGRIGSGAITHRVLLSRLDDRLNADSRFQNVRWFTQGEYELEPAEPRTAQITDEPLPAFRPTRTENFNLGLLRTLLWILLPFFALPLGLIQVGRAIDAYENHGPAMSHVALAIGFFAAGFLGAPWLYRQRW